MEKWRLFLPTEAVVKEAIQAADVDVAIAAINGPQTVIISGAAPAVEQMVAAFTQKEIEVRSLNVSQAFHSPLVAPMIGPLGEALGQVSMQPLRLPLVSSLTGDVFPKGSVLTADYWQRHTLEAVRFVDGLNSVVKNKCRIVIEIGPHPVLSRQGQRCDLDPDPSWLPSLVKHQGDWSNLSKSLATLYTQGIAVDWDAFEAQLPGKRQCLPTYPFQRKSYWAKNANLPHYPYLSNTAPISAASIYTVPISVASTSHAANIACVNGRLHDSNHNHRNNNGHGNGHSNGQHSSQTPSATRLEPLGPVQLSAQLSAQLSVATSEATPVESVRQARIVAHLQAQVAQMLRLAPLDIDVNASLVEMGADSISLLEMVHELERTYGISLSITELFRFSHLAAIADHLDETLPADWALADWILADIDEVASPKVIDSEMANQKSVLEKVLSETSFAQQAAMDSGDSDRSNQASELAATIDLLKHQLDTLSQVMTAQLQALDRVAGNVQSTPASVLPDVPLRATPSSSGDKAADEAAAAKVFAKKQPDEQQPDEQQPKKNQSDEKPLTVTFADRTQPLRLSHAQERLWFLSQLEGESATYNIPIVLKIEGLLNRTAFEQSIQSIVDRHESLRTSFTTQNDQPVQQIHAAVDWAIATVDLRSDKTPIATAAKLAQAEIERPFDLTQPPLFRVVLLEIDDRIAVLVLTIHHIVSDAWSMGRVFVEELRQGYCDRVHPKENQTIVNGHINGHKPSPHSLPALKSLPELRVQYADFAEWHRNWLQGPAGERQLSYWKKQLADMPSCLELPTDYPRPKVKTYRGDTVRQVLPSRLVSQLTQISQASGVTLFMTLLSAYGCCSLATAASAISSSAHPWSIGLIQS